MNIPEELKYTKDHEWLKIEGDVCTIGITDFAQDHLTDVVFVELPEVGDRAEAGKTIATVESVKAVSDVFSPVTGEVVGVNEALPDEPEKVNEDPYGDGWMVKIKMENPAETEALLNAEEYEKHCESGD